MQYNRNQDLTKVFDARWKANHNNDIQNLRERDNIRREKILSSNPSEYLKEEDFNNLNINNEPVKSNKDIQLERLEQNMNVLRQNRSNFND